MTNRVREFPTKDKLPPLVTAGREGFEQIPNFKVDVEKLRQHLESVVIPFAPPIMTSPFFGGWSVYSSDGTFNDGFQQGQLAYKKVDGKMVFDREMARQLGLKDVREYNRPTEICTGYLAEVMKEIEKLGFTPLRSRITVMNPGGAIGWHRDSEDHEYSVRIHVPITTNPECFFLRRMERYSMPADGSGYLVRVNNEHSAVNFGESVRYHLIMQAWDHKKLSQFNQFDPAQHALSQSPQV